MTEDVSEPVWRGNGEVVLGGLGEEPAAEMFGIDGRGGSIGEADVGLAVGGKKECGRSGDGEELLEWRGFVGFLAQLFHECTFWHESTALGEAARRDEKRGAAEVVEEKGVRVGKFISISWDGDSQFLVF